MLPLLALALASTARADTPDTIPAGTALRITGIGKEDAFFRDRKSLVGLACRVADPGLERNDKRHHGGPVTCNDGEDYYFYQVRFDLLDDVSAAAAHVPAQSRAAVDTDASLALVAAMTGEAVAGVAGAAAEAVPAVVAPTPAPTWPVGARARIASVSGDDAYGKQGAEMKGLSCTVADNPLEASGAGWWAGQLQCEGDSSYYFYQVSLTAVDAPAPTTATFAAGKLVKVLAVDPLDTLYVQRGALEGHTCSVAEAPLVPSGPDLFAGRLFCDDGKQWQVFRVKLTAP